MGKIDMEKLVKEAARIQEDADLSKRRHYNAGDIWNRCHYGLGIPATVAAGIAGLTVFGEHDWLPAAAAGIAAILTSLMTFLNAAQRAEQHRSFAGQYDALMVAARQFFEFQCEGAELEAGRRAIHELTQKRNELNQAAPQTPRRCFERARKDIAEGASDHAVDFQNPKDE